AIGSIEDLKKLTTPEGPPPKTSNDTTPLLQQLGKESGTDNQTGGQQQQQDNQTGGQQQQPSEQGQQPEGNQTAGTAGGQQQQEGNQTGQGQEEGNQTGGPLGEVGEAIGKLFQ
ncbi:MAG TPA: hypothetical protein VLA74_06290, partial [Nitrososphaeraceae archaeon]|nr:hypothetical protein [Nitrososphaeraceae archaeon]